MTPRTSQCSGRFAAAGTIVADSIFTSAPNLALVRSPQFLAGAANVQAEIAVKMRTGFRLAMRTMIYLLRDNRDPRGIGAREQFVAVEQQRAARVDGQRGRAGFAHHVCLLYTS